MLLTKSPSPPRRGHRELRGRAVGSAERARIIERLVEEHTELAVHTADGGESRRHLRVEGVEANDLFVRSDEPHGLAWRVGDLATGTCRIGRVEFELHHPPTPLPEQEALYRAPLPDLLEILCKRQEFRTKPMDPDATLQLDGRSPHAPRPRVLDVSPHGVGVGEIHRPLRVGEEFPFSILHLRPNLSLPCPVVVRWSSPGSGRVGMEFRSPDAAVLRPLRAYVIASQINRKREE